MGRNRRAHMSALRLLLVVAIVAAAKASLADRVVPEEQSYNAATEAEFSNEQATTDATRSDRVAATNTGSDVVPEARSPSTNSPETDLLSLHAPGSTKAGKMSSKDWAPAPGSKSEYVPAKASKRSKGSKGQQAQQAKQAQQAPEVIEATLKPTAAENYFDAATAALAAAVASGDQGPIAQAEAWYTDAKHGLTTVTIASKQETCPSGCWTVKNYHKNFSECGMCADWA